MKNALVTHRLSLAVFSLLPLIPSSLTAVELLGRWALDEGTGTTAADSSAFQRPAALLQNPTWISDGIAGPALRFDGVSGQYGDIAGTSALHLPGSFSISAWARFSNVPTEGHLLGKHAAGTENGYFLSVHENRFCFFSLSDGSRLHSAATYQNAGWHLATATYDSQTLVSALYVDGVFQGSHGGGRCGNNGENLRLGGVMAGATFYGYAGDLDEVRLYDGVLSPAEILALYQNPAGAIPEPTAAALLVSLGVAWLAVRRLRTAARGIPGTLP